MARRTFVIERAPTLHAHVTCGFFIHGMSTRGAGGDGIGARL
jgi:hypothetical protein